MVDLLNGYGGDANLLHDVDMANLFFGGDEDDDYFDPDFDDQLDFLVGTNLQSNGVGGMIHLKYLS